MYHCEVDGKRHQVYMNFDEEKLELYAFVCSCLESIICTNTFLCTAASVFRYVYRPKVWAHLLIQ